MAELAVQDVTVHFGGVRALAGVDLDVPGGRVTGLIGPNGAGKTTLFDVITGLRAPNSGKVLLGGNDVTALAPHRRARLGLARTFQRLELFGTLTARENVQMALEAGPRRRGDGRRRARGSRRPAAAAERADALLSMVGAGRIADEPADLLPTGLARLVELARALATSPSVLLLDEPSAGLDDRETSELAAVLEKLASAGTGVLLVEHDMGLVMGVCRHVAVMDFGAIVAEGDPQGIQRDPVVQAAYLGSPEEPEAASQGATSHGATSPAGSRRGGGRPEDSRSRARAPDERAPDERAPDERAPTSGGTDTESPALELSEVRAGYGRIEIVRGVSLSLARGSILALLGPNGAGKSTLLKAASGQLAPMSGHVRLEGRDIAGQPGERLVRRGLCAVPEGRPVFPNLTVAENLLMYSYACKGMDASRLEEQSYERFPVLRDRRRQLAGRLSGGEQQALALARALCSGARVLLVDEISMGLAPMVVADLYQRLERLVSEESVSVLLVEQFAKTALALAGEAAIMVNGRIVRRGSPAELEPELLGSYMGAT